MKKISRLQVTAWVLSLLPAAMTAVFYSRLPAEIPMQWDLAGHMNYETRWHLWIVAGMAPLFAVLFYFLPRFDPKSRNYSKFYDVYIGFQIMIDLFHNLDAAAKKYGMDHNYVAGANIAGFEKVVDAMTAQGIV